MRSRNGCIAGIALFFLLQGCGGGDDATYTVGGAASGLTGSGLILTLNGSADLAVGGTGSFTFATTLDNGNTYTVAVKTQPANPSQTCAITNATGTVSAANVSNVSVACTANQQPVGGAVSGLAGSGLVLRLNGANDLPINANGTFTFPNVLASGATYAVTVRTQPTVPFQTCVPTPAAGVVGVSTVSVAVICTNDTFAVGGTVTGLTGSGLTLQLNGGNDLAISSRGSFAFPTKVLRGANYAVTVKSQTGAHRELCAVGFATGSNLQADITSVNVSCLEVSGFLYVGGANNQLLLYGIHATRGQQLGSASLLAIGPVATISGSSNWDVVRSPDGKYLYAREYISARINAFGVDQSKGTLTPLGSVSTSNTSAGAVDLVVAPSGRFLYVSNVLTREVVRVSIDAATGALASPVQVATIAAAGTEVQAIGITPNGAFLYVLSGGNYQTGVSSTLTLYGVNTTTGALTAGSTLSVAPTDSLSIDPLGRFLYLQGSLNIAPFGFPPRKVYPYAINAGTGALTAVGSGTELRYGRGWVIDPTGRYAYYRSIGSASSNTNYMHSFLINQSTGAFPSTEIYTPVTLPGTGGPGFTIDPTGWFLFTLNTLPADAFPPTASIDGSTVRITQTGSTAGYAAGVAHIDAGVGGGANVIVVVP